MAVEYSIKLERDEESGNVVMILLKDKNLTGTFMVYSSSITKDDLLQTLESWFLFKAIPVHVYMGELKKEIEAQWPQIQTN